MLLVYTIINKFLSIFFLFHLPIYNKVSNGKSIEMLKVFQVLFVPVYSFMRHVSESEHLSDAPDRRKTRVNLFLSILRRSGKKAKVYAG